MNRVQTRFSRGGVRKLARALAPATVRAWVVSDVIGDDLASIGSGPLVPDPATAREVRDLLRGALFLPLFEGLREERPVFCLIAEPQDFDREGGAPVPLASCIVSDAWQPSDHAGFVRARLSWRAQLPTPDALPSPGSSCCGRHP